MGCVAGEDVVIDEGGGDKGIVGGIIGVEGRSTCNVV
jgi:hypothetical protein